MYLVPDTIRRKAGWVIQQCVDGQMNDMPAGTGGYVTVGMGGLVGYIVDLTSEMGDPARWRKMF